MASDSCVDEDLLRRAADGDQDALAKLFGGYRERLKRMVRLRLDRRLRGRVEVCSSVGRADRKKSYRVCNCRIGRR